MANRFWVGGSGTWDAADTSHWSASSGGAAGASVPTTGDAVTFDGSSGTGTVVINTTINIGSIAAGTFVGTLDFATNNNNVTLVSFNMSGTTVRTLNMGNGTWTMTGTSGVVWSCSTPTDMTLNAGSSTLLFTDAGAGNKTLAFGGNLVYNNISITGGGAGTITWNNTCVVNNLTLGAPKTYIFLQTATITINGTFTAVGTAGNLVTLQSSTTTNFNLLKAAGQVICNYLSIADCNAKGGASWYAGVNSTDAGGGNTGWQFSAPDASKANFSAVF